jgi:hypothetical protein
MGARGVKGEDLRAIALDSQFRRPFTKLPSRIRTHRHVLEQLPRGTDPRGFESGRCDIVLDEVVRPGLKSQRSTGDHFAIFRRTTAIYLDVQTYRVQ